MTRKFVNQERELFDDVRPLTPTNLRFRMRKVLRDSYLSILAKTQKVRTETREIRCFNCHYVFDDQRGEFATVIKALKNYGEFVNTDAMVDMVEGKMPVDGRYFHLSFDDGLKSLLRNAAPVLDQYDVPTLIFVNSNFVGAPESDPVQGGWTEISNYRKPIRVMTWAELKESNFEIGAHTRTHKLLAALDENSDELESEIRGCKVDIEQALGQPCQYFAWPFGTRASIAENGLKEIEKAGYRAAFGSYRTPIEPKQTPLMQIPRQHFETNWPIDHIRLVANGGLEK